MSANTRNDDKHDQQMVALYDACKKADLQSFYDIYSDMKSYANSGDYNEFYAELMIGALLSNDTKFMWFIFQISRFTLSGLFRIISHNREMYDMVKLMPFLDEVVKIQARLDWTNENTIALQLLHYTKCMDPFNDLIAKHYNIYRDACSLISMFHKNKRLDLLNRYNIKEKVVIEGRQICDHISRLSRVTETIDFYGDYDAIKYISEYFNISSIDHEKYIVKLFSNNYRVHIMHSAVNYAYMLYVLRYHINLKDVGPHIVSNIFTFTVMFNYVELIPLIIKYVDTQNINSAIGSCINSGHYGLLEILLQNQAPQDRPNILAEFHKSHIILRNDAVVYMLYKYGSHNDTRLTKIQTKTLLDRGYDIKNKISAHFKLKMQERHSDVKQLFARKGLNYAIYDPNIARLICKFISYHDI